MRHAPNAVMMFAAGFGTRMKHLTQNQPKPMVQVAGRPLIDHALDLATAIVPDVIVANLHYLPDVLETHLDGTGVVTVREETDILETGGGLRNALPILGSDPVFTMNTDAIWAGPNPLELARQAWDADKMDALLVCVPTAKTVGYQGKGDFQIGPDGRLTRGAGYVFGGVQIIKTDMLYDVEDTAFSLNVVWNEMLKSKSIFGLIYPGQWCDVGHPGGILDAEHLIETTNV
ncbi:nucleotidyltransferase family protein [Ascidiaceihabitans sp.]|uniref:nucleotidyltransferase family protein n=1 Tax=Ascidiaceihabitans sp. TaxID=1872644 RepID=UPI00329724D3